MLLKRSVAIIGGGPAGLSAALQLKRHGVDHILIEKNSLGGLLRNALYVENYLGFPQGISGQKLVQLFKEQIANNHIEVLYDEVKNLSYNHRKFKALTCKRTIECKIVIIASGTRPTIFEKFHGQKNIEDRIFYEVHYMRGIRHKEIGVIGAGDVAFDYALNISENNKVVIFNRNPEQQCLAKLSAAAQQRENIAYLRERSPICARVDNGKLEVTFKFKKTIEKYLLDYLLFAIGRQPELGFIDNSLGEIMDELIEEKKMFLIGDVKNGSYRQAAIGVGNGIETAMRISEILQNDRQ